MVSIPTIEERLYVARGICFSVEAGVWKSHFGHDGDDRQGKVIVTEVWTTVAFVCTTLIMW